MAILLVAGTLRLLRFARNDNMDIMHGPMRASAPTKFCACFHIKIMIIFLIKYVTGHSY